MFICHCCRWDLKKPYFLTFSSSFPSLENKNWVPLPCASLCFSSTLRVPRRSKWVMLTFLWAPFLIQRSQHYASPSTLPPNDRKYILSHWSQMSIKETLVPCLYFLFLVSILWRQSLYHSGTWITLLLSAFPSIPYKLLLACGCDCVGARIQPNIRFCSFTYTTNLFL